MAKAKQMLYTQEGYQTLVDELEYLKNKNELEKNGLEMQDFDC